MKVDNGAEIRRMLIGKKVYVPMLWPNVPDDAEPDTLEYRYASDILPIPVDQRYGEKDMEYLAEMIRKCIS